MSKLDKFIEKLLKPEFFGEEDVLYLCNKAKELFIEEGNI